MRPPARLLPWPIGKIAVQRLAPQRGVPAEVVTTLYQDRDGFIWIGSRSGLALYDGDTFTLFEHDIADPSSLSDNAVRTVYEDSWGQLWVGTNTGGLNRLDRGTWKFEHFRHDSSDPTTPSVTTASTPSSTIDRATSGSPRNRA